MDKEIILQWMYLHPMETIIITAILVYITCMLIVLRK